MSKISKLKTYDAEPQVTTLAKFVRATMDGANKYAKQVKRYRQTGEAHLKTSLPLAIVGAVCEGGHAMKHVIEKTGWIALDIDASDNPHLDDAEAVRDAVGRLPFIVFSGLSVSGRGVWALVKIEDPSMQPRHFQQLQKDFEYYGITLDSTKGKNANDKRYYSYDPDAVINKDFEVYDRLPPEKSSNLENLKNRNFPDSKSSNFEHSDKYAEAALNGEIETLSRTANGHRNNQLFKSTASLAQLVAGGVLGKSEVTDALFSTARSIGLPKYEIETTIKSGFKAGMKEPRKPAKTNHSKPLRKKDNGLNGQCETKEFKNNSNQPNNFNQPTKEVESNEDPAPHGFNPYTGEVFDERGYPADWDSITLN